MPDYPVQISKVQAPPLRDETLARDRLLDWLSVKIHRRAVLVVAEAGYGKTTLLADFTRRTRIRVLWFRLDRGDRDWVGFIAYLVAAVRIHVPDFGQGTSALLRETATTAPPLDTVLETFLRELAALPNDPSAFVFDDFHLVDDSPDVRHILRELLTRAPERMSFVFASRSEPPVRLARLRALGEVAELGTDDLRFDAAETERLFRETYEMRLEPAMLAELNRRTEGWAASLQLVRAALHDRDPGQVRTFISSLSGAEGHLYEYLAEEVIGELPEELQQFLMRTSLLETVDLTLGPVAADVDEASARSLIEAGERHGLFGKGGPRTRHVVRAHPLVRDFLQARLTRAIGQDGIRAIHFRVAQAAESVDWLMSTRHYLLAERPEDAARALKAALDSIFATGAYAAAHDLAVNLPDGGLDGSVGLVLRSRIAQQNADPVQGHALAEAAFELEPNSTLVLVNLMSARNLAGDVDGAIDAGRRIEDSPNSRLAAIGRSFRLVLETSTSGSLSTTIRDLDSLVQRFRSDRDVHYLGIALLNAAYIRISMGEPEAALASADEAISCLSEGPSGVDLVAARMARASALAYIGDLKAARTELDLAVGSAQPGQALETSYEASQLEALLGDSRRAWPLVNQLAHAVRPDTDGGEQALLGRVLMRIQDGAYAEAEVDASMFRFGVARSAVAFDACRHLVLGLVKFLLGRDDALEYVRSGARIATQQDSWLWAEFGTLLLGLAEATSDPSELVIAVSRRSPTHLSMLAEAVVSRLPEMNEAAASATLAEARRRPERWLKAARRLVGSTHEAERRSGVRLLGEIGQREDIRRLRDVRAGPRSQIGQQAALSLARRLAPRIFVDDLGRVQISAGDRVTDGADVRRKVLALLCFLLSRPGFASTRDEVIDALWPESDPGAALNSLNQTVYFLRRLFEPDYEEETSPGYVGQDGETIWLDPQLVDCRSRACQELVRSVTGEPTPELALALAEQYRGRFALDFAYDDWSSSYRDSLHAAFLRVMEHAIRGDVRTGHFGRGIYLAERAIEVDPESDDIQLSLIRLYQISGAHAAAAEQYGHYANGLRELGMEPPAWAEITNGE